ncbi:MAG: acetylornithine deacetylase [Pseudomonadota bacterium]
MLAEDLLERLVGFRTVVGTTNINLMSFVSDYLKTHGIDAHRMPGPESDRENLFATIGDPGRPGYILSGHVDVVPAMEPDWRGDPFVLRHEGDRLIARGACDMKGYVAAMLSAVPDLSGMTLQTPIHLSLSYDEEAGCKGVPHLIEALPDLCAKPIGCFVGEPTELQPVLAHKGKAALRLVATGVSGHSARPDLGENAIHALIPALAEVSRQAERLAEGPKDTRFEPASSTIQIGTVTGGQAVNIIPDRAEAHIEARSIAGANPRDILAPIIAKTGKNVFVEWLSTYPSLALEETSDLARLCTTLAGKTPRQAVSFGTEAGLFQEAGIPSIICGPGNIDRAHRPEEFLKRDELEATRRFIMKLGKGLSV